MGIRIYTRNSVFPFTIFKKTRLVANTYSRPDVKLNLNSSRGIIGIKTKTLYNYIKVVVGQFCVHSPTAGTLLYNKREDFVQPKKENRHALSIKEVPNMSHLIVE